ILDGGRLEVQRAACHHGATRVVGTALHVGNVNRAVGLEVGVQHDVTETALEEVVHLGCARYLGLLAVGGDQLDGAGLLGNQYAAVGQELQRPGLVQLGDGRADEGIGL